MKIVWLLMLLLTSQAFAQQAPKKIKLPNIIREASGLFIEGPDKLWWHNDSGGEPSLYLTDRHGTLIDSLLIKGAVNRDWEDMTVDPNGNWYLGDFGNNRNNRQDLTIYIWKKAEATLDSIRFSYPEQKAFPPPRDQWKYNLEGFFWDNDSLHIFTKNKIGQGNDVTRHYALSDKPGTQQARLVDSCYLKNRVVTAAAMSHDGEEIALVAYTFGTVLGFIPRAAATLYVWSDYPPGKYFQGTMRAYRLCSWPLPTQFECVDFWDDDTVIVASEATLWQPARARRVKLR
ncbi:MAG: hypothetical protein NWR72_04105 [Bacteroidia bacterium]|nr:hypothetical protein [Bacteroidia bacterium]